MRLRIKLFHKFVIIMILLAVLPLLIVSFGFKPLNFQGLVAINRLALEDAILELHIQLASSLSEKIDDYINNIKKDLSFMIGSQRIGLMSWQKKEAVLRSLLVSSEDFVSVSIVDRNGNEMIKAYSPDVQEEPKVIDRSSDPTFQKAVKEGFQISDLYYKGDDPRLNVVYPLEENQYIFIVLTLKKLWNKVLSVRLGATGYAFLVNSKGEIIAHPERSLAKSFTSALNLDIVKEVLSRKVLGSKEYVTPGGQAMVGAYAAISSLNWGAIIQQPKEEAFFSATKMRKSAIFWTLVSIFVAALVAFITAGRLSRPILGLIKGAHRVSQGDFTYQVKVRTHDEMGDLANTFNQMTGRLKAYSEMQVDKIFAEQKKLDAVIFSISDGIVMTDLSGKIMLMNKQAKQLLNIAEDAIEGKDIWDYIKDEKIMDSFEEILREKDKTVLKEIDLSEDDYRKILKAGTNVVKSRRGENLGVVTVLHDITLEKEIEQMKEDFLHAITHDLRSPMTSIRGYLEVILDGMAGELNPQQEKFLKIVDQSSERLLGMINNILDIAKLEAGKMQVNLGEMNLKEIADGVVETMAAQAQRGQIHLSVESINEIKPLMGDKALMERVLINLVGNALKFTPQQGKVTIKLEDTKKKVEVSVVDTGEGIPPEYVDKIFDKFQQVRGKEKKGTGLGLAITKHIVDAHLGKIWVESELGKGSRFIFWIPRGLTKDEGDKVVCQELVT